MLKGTSGVDGSKMSQSCRSLDAFLGAEQWMMARGFVS